LTNVKTKLILREEFVPFSFDTKIDEMTYCVRNIII